MPEFAKRNVKVCAISVDSAEKHKGWISDINETQNTTVDYPIIAGILTTFELPQKYITP